MWENIATGPRGSSHHLSLSIFIKQNAAVLNPISEKFKEQERDWKIGILTQTRKIGTVHGRVINDKTQSDYNL